MGPLAAVAFLVFYLWCIAWVIGDCQKRGLHRGWILVLVLFSPLVAPIIWLVFRPATSLAERLPDDYMNADDALLAASRLDGQGDWDAAIQLYENAAKRWPDNSSYISSCIETVRQKQSQFH
jgi:hypothetical protein